MVKKKSEQMEGLFWAALGLLLSFKSFGLGLGTLHKPGAGLPPFLTGIILIISGGLLLVSKLLEGSGERRREEISLPGMFAGFGKEGFLSIASLFLYALFLESLGFVVATFLLLFFLFKIRTPRKWVSPMLISLITVTASYLLFYVWFRIEFPAGIFR